VIQFLLDTNICVYFLNGMFNLKDQIRFRGFEHCAISEITIAELKYGVAKSAKKEANAKSLALFQSKLKYYPFTQHSMYMRLKKLGLKPRDESLTTLICL